MRNKTPKTLRLQCFLSSHEFKIRKDNRSDSDQLTVCKFVLHGHESRPLIISFAPTKIGPAFDELVFTPLDTDLKQTKKQCVRLWGYGGNVCTELHNVSRDNTGKSLVRGITTYTGFPQMVGQLQIIEPVLYFSIFELS